MNYESLLRIPYKSYKMLIILISIILIILLLVGNIFIYDVYNTYAYYKNDNLTLNIPIIYSDTILNGEYMVIDNQKYAIEVLYISDILIDSETLVNYQEVILHLTDSYPENLVVNTHIYYNKEKVFAKLWKLIKGA